MIDRVSEHYRTLLKQHGDSAESAQYSSRESQECRFSQLIKIGQLEGSKILDFGCGTAHFATYLKSLNINVQYTGADTVEEFFSVAKKKHPQHRFGLYEEFSKERFDYVFISGVFNNKRRDNRNFYQNWIRELFSLCDRGLAFNMMSTYVDYKDKNLFYEKPERAFSFVKSEITPFVTLRHDYEVKQDVIPFEFVIFAYRDAVI